MNLDGLEAVYLLRLTTTVIKIGRTANPIRRIKQHVHNATCFGIQLTNSKVYWVSNSVEVERALKEAFELYERPSTGNEWFKGFTWSEAISVFDKVTETYGEQHGP